MTLADCFFTMLMILLPQGIDSRFEGLRFSGDCSVLRQAFAITKHHELQIETKFYRFIIPLPQREDRVKLSYHLKQEYAYLGTCKYGYKPYIYKDSVCQRVMVRFGPKETT